MSILDKVQFWKHSGLDDLDLGLDKPMDLNTPGLPPQQESAPPQPAPSIAQPRFEEPSPRHAAPPMNAVGAGSPKDLEMISAKLDTIRAMVENISQRLEMMERGQNPQEPRRGGW